MFGEKKKLGGGPIATLIGADTRIEGSITFKGGLRIDGQISGNVCALEGEPSMLVLSENGRIDGEVRASHLVLNGTVVGPIQGEDLIELQPKARITGNVRYRALEMHHGAVIEGSLTHLEGARPGLKLAASNE
jgi:cytoskeletal protein CcmA (bactofilin family)